MAYDEKLAVRVRKVLKSVSDVEETKMFGGLSFMVKQHLCAGVIDNMLMARVGPDQYSESLDKKYTKEMTFTGKPLKGMIYVEFKGISTDDELSAWIDKCLTFVTSLPTKKRKVGSRKKKNKLLDDQ